VRCQAHCRLGRKTCVAVVSAASTNLLSSAIYCLPQHLVELLSTLGFRRLVQYGQITNEQPKTSCTAIDPLTLVCSREASDRVGIEFSQYLRALMSNSPPALSEKADIEAGSRMHGRASARSAQNFRSRVKIRAHTFNFRGPLWIIWLSGSLRLGSARLSRGQHFLSRLEGRKPMRPRKTVADGVACRGATAAGLRQSAVSVAVAMLG
jgi:hypothetical protein